MAAENLVATRVSYAVSAVICRVKEPFDCGDNVDFHSVNDLFSGVGTSYKRQVLAAGFPGGFNQGSQFSRKCLGVAYIVRDL